jgi:pimeloyl-ACP methyl ester carboxylesterase
MQSFHYPYTVHKLTITNGCDIAYIDEGTGDKTLLFIHGLATYAPSWKKNIDQLQQHYRCIAIDLPGNGLSSRGDYPYGINFFAGCVYDLIRKLQLKNLTIVGHSMGGQVALTILANEPTAAEKLVLCAPAGFETFTIIERTLYTSGISFFDMFSTDENSLRQTIHSSFYHFMQEGRHMTDDLINLMKQYPMKEYRKMIDGCIHGMLNEPVYDMLPRIQQPTLVMFGEYDALVPNKLIHHTNTRQLAEDGVKRMPHAQLEMIPNCGHFLQIEKTDAVNLLIRNFVM